MCRALLSSCGHISGFSVASLFPTNRHHLLPPPSTSAGSRIRQSSWDSNQRPTWGAGITAWPFLSFIPKDFRNQISCPHPTPAPSGRNSEGRAHTGLGQPGRGGGARIQSQPGWRQGLALCTPSPQPPAWSGAGSPSSVLGFLLSEVPLACPQGRPF